LFFHLQRSPWLRGINFQKKDEVTFEVIEVNGRCEAVKLLLPNQVQELEDKKLQSGEATDPNEPAPRDLVGQRVGGFTKSHYLLVAKQNWGFVSSDSFSGQVFWHMTENPEMQDVEFDRDDLVEFDVCLDEQRGSQVRAKNMRFVAKAEKPKIEKPYLSESKRKKKEQWLRNWSATPPPDWVCKFCGWQNFGRNKTCNFNDKNNQNCPGLRPPREEWPDVQDRMADELGEDDQQAKKALWQKKQAHIQFGKEEEVPVGWHSEGLQQELQNFQGEGAEGNDQFAALPSTDPGGHDQYAALPALPSTDPGGAWSSDSWQQQQQQPPPKQKQVGHIPVPVLGADPSLLAAGLPGAIAAQKLKDQKALEDQQEMMAAAQMTPLDWEAQQQQQQQLQYQDWGQQQMWEQQQQQQQNWGQIVPPPQVVAPPRPGGVPEQTGPDANVRAMLALCLSAFNDFAASGEPISTSEEKVATLAAEVNSVLGADRSAKHAFAMQLAKNQWIMENGFEVRYKPGQNLVVVTRSAGVGAGAGGFGPVVVQPPQWGAPAEQQEYGPEAGGIKRKAEWGPW